MFKLIGLFIDLRMLAQFKADTQKLWGHQGDAYQEIYGVSRQKQQGTITVERRLEPDRPYQAARRRINHSVLRVIDLARNHGVPVDTVSLPPAHMKGPKRAVNIIQAIINDEAYGGVNHRTILDAIDQIVGGVRRQLHLEMVRLISPGVWLLDIMTFVARLPFLLLLPTGVDVRRLESTGLGKTVKFVGSVGWPVLAAYVYLRFNPHTAEVAALLEKIKHFKQIIWPA